MRIVRNIYIILLFLVTICPLGAAMAQSSDFEGEKYYDLTKPSSDGKENSFNRLGFYAGIGFQNTHIDYNSDDPDNDGSRDVFADEFSGGGLAIGVALESGTSIELNLFRKKEEQRSHIIKVRAVDVLFPILKDKADGIFLDLGISHITSVIKTRNFYQRALGFNIGLAYELPIYDDFAVRASTKAVIVDKSDDIGVDNVYMHGLALLYYF
jgi:hypothetical protein